MRMDPCDRNRSGEGSAWSDRPRRLPQLAALALLSFAACAAPREVVTPAPAVPPAPPPPAPKSLFVLLPEPDGKAGAIAVSNAGGSQVLARPFEATRAESPSRAPMAPFAADPGEVDRIFGPALAALPELAAVYLLYFEKGSTQLTADSKDLLPRILAAVRGRRSVDTSVVGHTDTVGAKDLNRRLALQRATAVGETLVSLGVDPSILEVTSHGEEVLLVPTGDEVPEPRNRRVEVTVR